MYVILFVLCIVIANLVTASLHPLAVGPFLIPAGSFFIGLTIFLRNIVQMRLGRRKTYYAIAAALIASTIASRMLGDTLAITIASAISFAFSETGETETFTKLRGTLFKRIMGGGVVGGFLDSAIFVSLGLSPIGAGFMPWSVVPMAIIGQFLVKIFMQFVGIGLLNLVPNADRNGKTKNRRA